MRFKNNRAYHRWLAYNYIHNEGQMGTPPHQDIYIGGKKRKVKHL